jgi:LPXTG-motif cell wall-anchored protein
MYNTSGNRVLCLAVLGTILAYLVLSAAVSAQDASTTSTNQSGQSTVSTEVKSAKVVYVSGNDVVVKMDDNGQIKHVVVPDDVKINVDGKDLTVHDLKPGMHVTRTITTTSTPKTITTVRTVKGRVWYVNPPSSLILTLPDGTNKQYKVPAGQKFEMNGKMHDLFDIKKGEVISATAITESPEVEESSARSVSGTLPPPPPTPPAEAVLLIEEPTSAAPAPAQEMAQATLPKTGSTIPLIGLLGFLLLGIGCILRTARI